MEIDVEQANEKEIHYGRDDKSLIQETNFLEQGVK